MAESQSSLPRPRVLLQGGGRNFKLSPFEIIALLLVIGVAAYGGFTGYQEFIKPNKALPVAQNYVPPVRTTLTSSVSATGTANSSQQVNLTFDIGQGSGKITEFFAKLGDSVVAGQPLAKLDDTDLSQSLKSAEAALNSAQARLNAVTSPTSADRASAQQSISTAQSGVTNAQKTLDTLLAGPLPADVLSANQALLQAQASLTSAQTAASKGQSQITSDQQALNSAQTDLNTAQSGVSTAQRDLQTAASNVAAANAKCQGTTFVTTPVTTGATVSTINALPFNFSCQTDATSGSSSSSSSTTATGANKTALQSQISAFNTAVGAYNTAQSGVTKAQSAVNSAQQTLTNDRNNTSNLDAAVKTAQASVSVAEQKKTDTNAPAKAADVSAARSSLDAAKKSLEAAQAKYTQLLNPTPDTVLPLQASVAQAEADVETAKKTLAAATITAPFDGQISQVTGDVGTQVSSSTVVFILLNPKVLRLDANVDQAYISNVKAGEPATVTFDALPGQTYQALVSAVGLTPTVQQGVVSYTITLGLDTTQIPAGTPIPTPGMTASINVVTSQTANALSVPTRAIRRIGRNQTVQVKTDTGFEQRTITTGATNGTLIQVTSGLSDTDQVLIPTTPTAGSTTQKTGTQQNGFPNGGPPAGGPPGFGG